MPRGAPGFGGLTLERHPGAGRLELGERARLVPDVRVGRDPQVVRRQDVGLEVDALRHGEAGQVGHGEASSSVRSGRASLCAGAQAIRTTRITSCQLRASARGRAHHDRPRGGDGPARDDLPVARRPDPIVQVERRPDLAGDEVERFAQWRRVVHLDDRMLVGDPDARCREAPWRERAAQYSSPTTRRPTSSTARPGWRLMTVPRTVTAHANGRPIGSSSGSISA